MAKILLVDDNELVRYALSRVLSEAGYEVIEAKDGVVALKLFKTTKPALVLMDIVMPELDGIGLLREIRAIDKAVPVIAMSGGGELVGVDILLMAQTLGANDILVKSFDDEVLLTKVSVLL